MPLKESLYCVALHCVLCYITFHYKFRRIMSNEDKIIIQNDYKEKSWAAYKIWKNHLSKKWDYSFVKGLLKKIIETGSIDRRHGSGRPRTGWTRSSSSTWKHHKWLNGVKTEEKPTLVPLGKVLKVTYVWSKKRFTLETPADLENDSLYGKGKKSDIPNQNLLGSIN